MKSILYKNLIGLFILMSSISCKDNLELNSECECSNEPRLCTYNYVEIAVYLKDQNNEPIILDEYFVKKIKDGETVNVDIKSNKLNAGYYSILSDSQMKLTNPCGEEFQFVGIKNGKQLVDTKFKIAHDCCHVRLLEGEKEITINLNTL